MPTYSMKLCLTLGAVYHLKSAKHSDSQHNASPLTHLGSSPAVDAILTPNACKTPLVG